MKKKIKEIKKNQRNKKKNFPQVTAPSLPIFLTHRSKHSTYFPLQTKKSKETLSNSWPVMEILSTAPRFTKVLDSWDDSMPCLSPKPLSTSSFVKKQHHQLLQSAHLQKLLQQLKLFSHGSKEKVEHMINQI